MLSSPGIGSGLDVSTIVGQLIAIEQQPIVRLGVQEVELQTQLSALGKLKNSLSEFRDAMDALGDLTKFQVFSATSSDEDVFTASASSTAAKGVFGIQVDRIAEHHRMASSITFADIDTTLVGTAGDKMTIQVGTTSFEVDFGGKTLAAVRDAINDATDNASVTASILTDNTGNRLILSADDTGSTSALSVSYSGVDPFTLQTLNADRDGDLTFTAADLDAQLTIEGQFTVTRTSNSISDVIQGVTLDLVSAGTSTVTVDRDLDAVQNSVQEFVTTYNSLFGTIDELRNDVLRTESTSLISLESQLRAVLNTEAAVGGQFSLLFEIGVSTSRSGTLELDTEILSSALATDFEGIGNLFADPTVGYAARLESLADGFLDVDGFIDAREVSLGNQIDDIGDRRADLEFRVQSIEERLLAQFTALDVLLTRMNTTSTFLTQQLDVLANLNSFISRG